MDRASSLPLAPKMRSRSRSRGREDRLRRQGLRQENIGHTGRDRHQHAGQAGQHRRYRPSHWGRLRSRSRRTGGPPTSPMGITVRSYRSQPPPARRAARSRSAAPRWRSRSPIELRQRWLIRANDTPHRPAQGDKQTVRGDYYAPRQAQTAGTSLTAAVTATAWHSHLIGLSTTHRGEVEGSELGSSVLMRKRSPSQPSHGLAGQPRTGTDALDARANADLWIRTAAERLDRRHCQPVLR